MQQNVPEGHRQNHRMAPVYATCGIQIEGVSSAANYLYVRRTGNQINERNSPGDFVFVVREQQNCHVEGIDFALQLLEFFLLSTQLCEDSFRIADSDYTFRQLWFARHFCNRQEPRPVSHLVVRRELSQEFQAQTFAGTITNKCFDPW